MYLFRLNKVIVFVVVNISILFMIFLLLYGSYWIGCMVLGNFFDLYFGDFFFENVKLVLE